MYCRNCGAAVNENFRVCPQCGTPVHGEEQHLTTNSTYYGSLGNPTPALVWGILGLAFSLTFYLSFLGIIFSCIGIRKASNYNEFTRSAPSKKAKIGRRLSISGVIIGSIFTIRLIVIIALAVNYRYLRYYY